MRKTGFTLVELIVVIVLVGIVALIAAPRFFSQPAFDAARFHDAAISAIRYGQKVAVAQRRDVFVVTSASTVALCYDAGCTTPSNRLKIPGSDDYFEVNIPSGIGITIASFNFNSLGQPIPNAETILNISGDVAARQIVVERETGYVHKQP
ncbi:MAG: prepilin-type N-terminal cleavage/methylation domain-containing protein [Hydrogenophilales bacterium]|nr:prepilin-type N-terminal cleavage/methylation domain-containing protein [Hydrogenophilales bacterium]